MSDDLRALYTKHHDSIPGRHCDTYFDRALVDPSFHKMATFYGIYKVHKKKLSTRPIISCCGTFSQIFSKYIDHWMKKIVHQVLPSYVKNADSLIDSLQDCFPSKLPPGSMLFSIDAVSMYSNIDTDHGIQVVKDFFEKFKEDIPSDCPVPFITEALDIVMRNNVFQFGDTYWLQLIGCAMGTSAAVNYAYTYVGLLEVNVLLVNYRKYLLFYRRFIDDGIGIWNCKIPGWKEAFDDFMSVLNNFGVLKWTNTGFVQSLEFLDLTISIKNRQLHFKTYQKELNLYLYIPPLSAHPRDMLRGLIFGRLRAYYKQNTDKTDYYKMAWLLRSRLEDRGWQWKDFKKIFSDAHRRITGIDKKRLKKETGQPIFLHTTYHPRGLQRQQYRDIFKKTLGEVIPNRLIIAQQRPRNLKD